MLFNKNYRDAGFFGVYACAKVRSPLVLFLHIAAKKLANDVIKLGLVGFGTGFIKWMASFATNMLTSLLVPYIFFSLPHGIFGMLRGEVRHWIVFVAVVLKLFFPRHFPVVFLNIVFTYWLEMPGLLILLLTVDPGFFAVTLRENWIGIMICLVIGCYLLQEHIRETGGFRNSFTQSHGTLRAFVLFVYILPFI
ncbi:hypothetical protein MKW94_008232 [Papaver nudicaule]|uniref:Uncharacterized protein n=1 Tax=Papaver nudicaule TaxID=74823 RepID=A0AA41S7H7_PAPNU|nr:hypothetical protein [Papaver nudicaule]